MISRKNKLILQFSDGSSLIHKTIGGATKKINLLDIDHISFIFNKKNKTYTKDLVRFKDFKFRYLKF